VCLKNGGVKCVWGGEGGGGRKGDSLLHNLFFTGQSHGIVKKSGLFDCSDRRWEGKGGEGRGETGTGGGCGEYVGDGRHGGGGIREV
jgi:hypothetical protein